MATILIVDDDRKICRLEDIYLRSEGFDTLVARDGFEALSIIGQKRVDLIVADILMPNLDGQGLLRALREHYIATPVLMMTSKSAFEDKKRLFECGADDYMVKPVDLEELVLRIRAILRRYNISNARQLRIGDTILDYSSLEVRAPRRDPHPAAEGILPALPAALLPRPHLHAAGADGRAVGNGYQHQPPHGGRPHQPAAQPVRRTGGF